MVSIEQAHTASLELQGHKFQILIDADKAMLFKAGKITDVRDVLAVQKIFADAQKGMEANHQAMQNCFKTEDVLVAAAQIIHKGQFSLTTAYKAGLREQKLKQVIDIIHRNGVDPKTHAPHTIERIKMALEAAKVHIDEFTDPNLQAQEALKKIRPIIPIAFEIKEIQIGIPAQYAHQAYGVLKNFGTRKKEDWLSDGSLVAIIEIPGGMEQDMYDKLNAVCHGHVESTVIKTR